MLILLRKLLCLFILFSVAGVAFFQPVAAHAVAAHEAYTPNDGFFFLMEPVPEPLSAYSGKNIPLKTSDQDENKNVCTENSLSSPSACDENKYDRFMESPVRLAWKSLCQGATLVHRASISFYTHLLQAPEDVIKVIALATMLIARQLKADRHESNNPLVLEDDPVALTPSNHQPKKGVRVVDMNAVIDGKSLKLFKSSQAPDASIFGGNGGKLTPVIIHPDYTTVHVYMMRGSCNSGDKEGDNNRKRKQNDDDGGHGSKRIKSDVVNVVQIRTRRLIELASAMGFGVVINESGNIASAASGLILEPEQLIDSLIRNASLRPRRISRVEERSRRALGIPRWSPELTHQMRISSPELAEYYLLTVVDRLQRNLLNRFESMIREVRRIPTGSEENPLDRLSAQIAVTSRNPGFVSRLRQLGLAPRQMPRQAGEPSQSSRSQRRVSDDNLRDAFDAASAEHNEHDNNETRRARE